MNVRLGVNVRARAIAAHAMANASPAMVTTVEVATRAERVEPEKRSDLRVTSYSHACAQSRACEQSLARPRAKPRCEQCLACVQSHAREQCLVTACNATHRIALVQ